MRTWSDGQVSHCVGVQVAAGCMDIMRVSVVRMVLAGHLVGAAVGVPCGHAAAQRRIVDHHVLDVPPASVGEGAHTSAPIPPAAALVLPGVHTGEDKHTELGGRDGAVPAGIDGIV